MIGQHPQLAGLPELKLFCCETIGELEASLPSYWINRGITHRSPGLVRAVAQFEFGDQSLQSLNSARRWLRDRAHWTGADVLDVLLTRLTPRTAVEKSPDNVTDPTALSRLLSAYPAARYLHLTRHPLSTQRSMQEYRQRIVPEYPREGEPMYGIASWYETHRRICELGVTLSPERYMRVRAEDVLNDSERYLGVIAEWLGVRTDTAAIEAMKRPEESPFAHVKIADAGVSGGNDPGFLNNPTPRRVEVSSTLEAPRGWSADPSLWEMVVVLANHLGYFDEGGKQKSC